MCFRSLVLILLSSSLSLMSTATAQQAQSVTEVPSNKAASKLPPDAPVIEMERPCPADSSGAQTTPKSNSSDPATLSPALAPVVPTKSDAGCKIVVTRAEFEQLANALHPGGDPSTARNFAAHYAEMMVMAEKAHEAGFDQDPSIQTKARFSYLQLLGQSYSMQVREKARVVTDAEVAAYYKEHPEMFEQLEVTRVFVPTIREYDTGSSSSPAVLAADKAKLDLVAKRLYKEALAGVSFEKLEERAYKAAGNAEDTPPTNLGKLTRNTIPDQYRDLLFSLKVGQVSEMVPESNGWSIFKVISKTTIPLSEAKPQVQQLKGDAAVAALKDTTKLDLNQTYFGVPEPTTNPPRMRR